MATYCSVTAIALGLAGLTTSRLARAGLVRHIAYTGRVGTDELVGWLVSWVGEGWRTTVGEGSRSLNWVGRLEVVPREVVNLLGGHAIR